MRKEQYNEEMKQLEIIHDNNKRELYKKFAFANNPYKIGDMITDHVATIKIEKIQVHKTYDMPQCVYIGTKYNKDGKVSKKQDHNTIFQNNINK